MKRTAGEAKRQAQQLVREGQSQLSDEAASQQQRLAGGLRAFSAQLGQMADGGEEEGVAATMVRWAADMSEGAGPEGRRRDEDHGH